MVTLWGKRRERGGHQQGVERSRLRSHSDLKMPSVWHVFVWIGEIQLPWR